MTEDEKDIIEEGIVRSRRKVISFGDSKGITLSKKWLDIQKWLGKEVTELVSISNSIIVLTSPKEEEKALEFVKEYEKRKRRKE